MSMFLHRRMKAAEDPFYRTPFSLSLIWKLQTRKIRTVERLMAIDLSSLRLDSLFVPDDVRTIENWRTQQSTTPSGGTAA